MSLTDYIDSLSFLDQTCSVALHAIPRSQHFDSAPLHLIRTDIDTRLTHVHVLSTKLALALPAYAASIPLLRDLAHHAAALAHATRLLHDDLHGAALTKNIRNSVTEIIDALRTLVRSFLNNATNSSNSPPDQEYLLRIGTLHDLIAFARSPSGIPKDNQAAVYHSWTSDKDSLQDNLHEIARIIEQAETQDDTPNDLDDGWDEIGLGDATNLDKDELARAKNVHQVLRLTTLLHKRIFLDLLPYPSSAPLSAFDNLLLQSNLLLSTSDDIVAALYTPQDPEHLRKEILQLVTITTSLQTQTAVFLPATDQLTNQLQALSLKDGTPVPTSTSPSKKRADKKWFDTCVDQIVRLCSSLTKSSSQTESAT